MWRRIAVVVVWVLATVGTASITLAAVSRVGGEVSSRPAVPVAAADLIVASTAPTTTAVLDSSTTTATDWINLGPSTSTTGASATVATEGTVPPPVSTTSLGVATTSATTSPKSTTSATQPAVTTVVVGGVVTVRQVGTRVDLISAVPASGFTADVEGSGSSEIKVEFKSEAHESKYSAHLEAGSLAISTQENDDD